MFLSLYKLQNIIHITRNNYKMFYGKILLNIYTKLKV